MALGEKLRNARLNAKLTTTQVASSTRMKVQMVEDIEREDFRRIAAPIYGKGFIKLYAEKVGIDPAPLIEEYVGKFVNPQPIQLATESSHVLQDQGLRKLETMVVKQMDPDVIPELPKEQDLFSASKRSESMPKMEAQSVRRRSDDTQGRTSSAVNIDGFLAGWKKKWEELKDQARSMNDPWRRRDFSLPVIRFVESPVKWLSVLFGTIIILILLISTVSRVFHQAPREKAVPQAEETREQLRLGAELPAPYVD